MSAKPINAKFTLSATLPNAPTLSSTITIKTINATLSLPIKLTPRNEKSAAWKEVLPPSIKNIEFFSIQVLLN